MTTTLILAGAVIVAAAASVETLSDRYRTDVGDFQFDRVTGTALVDALPVDFAIDRYEWGGTELVRLPDPPAPPAPVPAEVTNFQARAALRAAGLLATVQAAIGSASEEAQDAWEYANVFTRHGTLVNAIGGGLGLTDEQLDDLFRTAATIEA